MAEFTVLMGGNRGDLKATFARGANMIAERIGPILATSRDHWTEPWGFQDEHLFLNRAVQVQSDRSPSEVMGILLDIEKELGRSRPHAGGFGPRTMDLDILFVEQNEIDQPGLTVPHPRVHLRSFALGPAADIVPELVHPRLGLSVLQLLNQALQAS